MPAITHQPATGLDGSTTNLARLFYSPTRFPQRHIARTWFRDVWALYYQDAAGDPDDPELVAVFPSEEEAMRFTDVHFIVPLALEHHEQQILVEGGRVGFVLVEKFDI